MLSAAPDFAAQRGEMQPRPYPAKPEGLRLET